MQKQKDQVMQPVTMAILIAIVILCELPSSSARINSSSPPRGNRVSPLAAETMGNTDEDPPSNFVTIPIFRDVNPNGFYYVQIEIGSPPKTYNLDIDSGSDLTWLPIPEDESQSMRNVRCDEPRCRDVHESTAQEGKCKNTEPCDYEIIYHDESTSDGLVVTDAFALHLKGGSSISPTVAIGASSGQSTTHGMLGLGKGKISILSQLQEQGHFANIFGHCLSSDREVRGFMFIGKDFDYPRCFTWVPMSSDSPYYSLTMAEVVYEDEQVLGWNQAFVFDSGTTYTYFVDSVYQKLLSKVEEMPLIKLSNEDDNQPCWKGKILFTSIADLRSYFSSIYLRLQNGKALQIPPENYLMITEAGDVCLGILNGLDVSLDNFNLIGAISMQNVMIAYDNEMQQIGWARVAGCGNLPFNDCTP